MSQAGPWWRQAVCYQVYVRSFADGDGDGVGDMAGIRSRLPYLADLGVDAVWITPFYPSPQHDHGYDVADYRDVDPLFGTLADFDAMLAAAHDLGLRVIVDVVPNHTSEQHPWFVAALAAAPGDPARNHYVFRDGLDQDGAEPPNNWQSMFGGPAWTRLPDGQWYLHLFDSSQPDLNWWDPEVGDEFESILRFWLDRGVDGFRVDVAHGLFKPADLVPAAAGEVAPHPMWDQPEVHDVYRRWHRVLAEYGGDRMAVAEAWSGSAESMARYIRPDELQQTFNFEWLLADWSATAFRQVVVDTFDAVGLVAGTPTWVLSNHDVVRETTRYGGGPTGLARARAAALTMLALPGSAYVFQGEELGLEQVDVPPEARQDPSWFRTGEVGRDGCRVPLPWSGTTPPYGFGPGPGQPWLPMPTGWAEMSVQRQQGDPTSTLEFFRTALHLRRELAPGLGGSVEPVESAAGTFAFRRDGLVCVVNCSDQEQRLPASCGELLLGSGGPSPAGRSPADQIPDDRTPDGQITSGQITSGRIPADTAGWFRHRD